MRMTMLAALLAATPALAQEPPTTLQASATAGTGTTTGGFDKAGDVDRYRIALKEGKDYAIGVRSGASEWTVRGPTGTALCSALTLDGEDDGCEFRAGRDGFFTIEGRAQEAGGYTFRLHPDCRKDVKTRCQIRPGATQQHLLTYGTETDLVRLAGLTAGRSYAVELIDPPHGATLTILKGTATVATGGSFKAGTGTYYARIENDNVYDGSGPYRLSLR